MATEFDNALHWGLFLTGTTLTSETGKYVRVSELVLSALRATGVFSNMVDGIVAPDTDRLWLDKNFDPAVLKEWDATGASWVPMTYGRLFGRAAIGKLAVTGGTGNAVVVSQPTGFQAARLYLMTPLADNSGATTINVSGVGSYPVKYGDGSDLSAVEFKAGRQAVLFFTGTRFEVLFPLALMSAAVVAAQASADAAAASALLSQKYAANPEEVEVEPGLFSSRHYLAKVVAYWSLITNTLGGWIHGATDKPTPTGADEIGIADSAGGLWGLKKVSLTNLAGWLSSLTQTLTNKTLVSPTISGNTTATSSAQFGPQIILQNEYNGGGNGYIIGRHSRAGVQHVPGDSLTGFVGQGLDTALVWQTAASINLKGTTVGSGYVTGRVEFLTSQGGTAASTRACIDSGFYMAGATGGDKGADTINAKGVYKDGVEIQPCILNSSVATTSGTAFDFLSIPSWVKEIRIGMVGVSLSGADYYLVQLGTGGSFDTTGYSSSSANLLQANGVGVVTSTTGFILLSADATRLAEGCLTLALVDAATNTWAITGLQGGASGATSNVLLVAGSKSLSGVLDRLRFTRNGSNTFDNGKISLTFKG